MRFSLATIALCAAQAVAGAAIEPRQAATCTPGLKTATYDDLTALPVDDGNTGLTSAQLNPYLDLNYTRFSVGSNGIPNSNSVYYTLSRISAGPLSAIQSSSSENHLLTSAQPRNALSGLLSPFGIVPPRVLDAPSIVGASPRTNFRINSFQFGCTLRLGGAATVVPVPCTVTIRPVEANRAGVYTCDYRQTPADRVSPGFVPATCTVPPLSLLLPGRGFTFQTTLRLFDTSLLGPLQSLVDTALESLVVSAFDNLNYLETCSIL
ncbi:hypothetical protein LQW54_009400 [Pestalotiopsis sp. IQ-011]